MKIKQKFESEEDFLNAQFVVTQEYITNEELKRVSIYSLKNLLTPLNNTTSDYDYSKKTNIVQFMHHLQIINEPRHYTLFIMLNLTHHVHLYYD